MILRAATLVMGAACALLSSGTAAARETHTSVVDAALAGVELCSRVFLTGMGVLPHRPLDQLYEEAGWRSVDAQPAHFPTSDIGNMFGVAELAPGVEGRVVSALGRGAATGGTRCEVLVLVAPGARADLLRSLDSSATWVALRIGDVPDMRMYGRATEHARADLGLTILWGATGEENRALEASLNVSLIPKASIATGVFPPADQ